MASCTSPTPRRRCLEPLSWQPGRVAEAEMDRNELKPGQHHTVRLEDGKDPTEPNETVLYPGLCSKLHICLPHQTSLLTGPSGSQNQTKEAQKDPDGDVCLDPLAFISSVAFTQSPVLCIDH